jgi:spore germination protein GerM
VLAALVVACGIPASGDVSKIPEYKLGALGDTLPASTTTTPPTTIEPTTTTIPQNTTTTIPTQDVTLYFISGGILRAFTTVLAKNASANEVMVALQKGPPSGDLAAGLRTAVPTKEEALLTVSDNGSGVATVDLPLNFFKFVKPEDQPLAIGQIVLTLTDNVRRIGQVLFTNGGAPTAVPRGAGDFSQPGQPLPPRDYLVLLESPVVTTTTTTTTTVPLTTPTTVV